MQKLMLENQLHFQMMLKMRGLPRNNGGLAIPEEQFRVASQTPGVAQTPFILFWLANIKAQHSSSCHLSR